MFQLMVWFALSIIRHFKRCLLILCVCVFGTVQWFYTGTRMTRFKYSHYNFINNFLDHKARHSPGAFAIKHIAFFAQFTKVRPNTTFLGNKLQTHRRMHRSVRTWTTLHASLYFIRQILILSVSYSCRFTHYCLFAPCPFLRLNY